VWVWDRNVTDYPYRYPALEVIADRERYGARDTVSVLVNTEVRNAVVLATLEGRELYAYRTERLNGGTGVVKFALNEEYAPNVFVTVTVRRGKDVHSRTLEIPVEQPRRDLRITLAPDRERYGPGDSARVEVTTRDVDGKPVPAELSLAVMDVCGAAALTARVVSEYVARGKPPIVGVIGGAGKSGSLALAAARDAGAEAYRSGILPSDGRRLTEVLESQLLRSDLVLIAGTFASGGFDMVQEALAELGEMRFRQVTMHPGPAQGFGRLGRDDIPVICIPGEPVAALVAFEVFVRPAIRLMLGKRQLFRRTVQAIAGQPLMSPLGYRQYLHGTVMRHPDGGYVVEPVGDGTEALLARMARANCLIVIDEDVTDVAAGGLVTVMPLLLGG